MDMRLTLAVTLLLATAACGDGGGATTAGYRGDDKLPNGMTIKEAIEARQHNLKDLGGAFKTINDQLAQATPNMQEIGFAAQEVRNHSMDIDTWFHEGTGPSAGVKTEALDAIWEDPQGFSKVAVNFEAAATTLANAAASGDQTAIAAAAKETGAACKACHTTYRQKKD
jgi:cytochrome c556